MQGFAWEHVSFPEAVAPARRGRDRISRYITLTF